MSESLPEGWENVEVIRPSESPILEEQKARRLAHRKSQLKRAVANGSAPADALDKFNAELQRAEIRERQRQDRDDAIDVAAEKIRNERDQDWIERQARERVAAEDGGG